MKFFFFYIFMSFDQFFTYQNFFSKNIRLYFSDISVKSSYRYIRDYRYFHPCFSVRSSFCETTDFNTLCYELNHYDKPF